MQCFELLLERVDGETFADQLLVKLEFLGRVAPSSCLCDHIRSGSGE